MNHLKRKSTLRITTDSIFALVGIFGGLLLAFAVSTYNFLLFHSFAELFSVAILCGVFFVSWNCRRYVDADYFPFLGTAMLGPALLDLMHLMTYKGLGVIPHYGANLPTELWIQARLMQACIFLAAPLLLSRKINLTAVAAGTALVTLLLMITAFTGVFPDCYVEGVGLTPFKIGSEYAICLLMALAMYLTYRRRALLDPTIHMLVQATMATTIVSELFFTFYVSVYGLSNVLGHLFKTVAYVFLYRAAIQVVLRDPMSLIFAELREREASLEESHKEFLAVLEGLEAAIYVVDVENYRTLFANRYLRQRLAPGSIEDVPCWKGIQGQNGPCSFCTIPALEEMDAGKPGAKANRSKTGVITWEYLHPVTQNWFLAHDRLVHWTDGRLARLQVAVDIDSFKEAEQLRDDIDSILRHDLKNPVNGILGMCKLLEHTTDLPEDQKEYLGLIKMSAENLLDLINRSLDLHKIERGIYEYTPAHLHLDSLLAPVVATNRATVSRRNITVTYDAHDPKGAPPLLVLGEGTLYRTVFSNLLGNAVEATPKGGETVVRTYLENDTMVVEFENPIPIPEDIRENFAQKFISSGKFGGTGLGAYSARVLTEYQGGKMTWQCTDHSTLIRLRLPLAPGQ